MGNKHTKRCSARQLAGKCNQYHNEALTQTNQNSCHQKNKKQEGRVRMRSKGELYRILVGTLWRTTSFKPQNKKNPSTWPVDPTSLHSQTMEETRVCPRSRQCRPQQPHSGITPAVHWEMSGHKKVHMYNGMVPSYKRTYSRMDGDHHAD